MKNICNKTLLLFIGIFLFGGFKNPNIPNNTIKISFTNVKEAKGFVGVGLYNNANSFPKANKHLIKKREEVKNKGTVIVELKNIEDGTYAIAASHDVDGDNEFDMTFGIPQEPFGFSNNIRHNFSAPSFDECKFEVKGGVVKSLSIKLE